MTKPDQPHVCTQFLSRDSVKIVYFYSSSVGELSAAELVVAPASGMGLRATPKSRIFELL